jgi:hypothetical protein
MVREWGKYRQTCAVIYFFKKREYRKYDISDPYFDQNVTGFVNTIANDHYFFNGGALNPQDVLSAIKALPLVLASTRIEHWTPKFDPLQYVAAFDTHTGKRRHSEEVGQPDVRNERRLKERQSTEDEQL